MTTELTKPGEAEYHAAASSSAAPVTVPATNGLLDSIRRNPTTTVVAAALALLALGGILFVDGFTSTQNVETVLRDAAFLGLVAVGMTFVVVSGSIVDLSVVPQMAVAATVATVLRDHGPWISITAALAACLLFSLVNALGTGPLGGNGVIVTLATATAGIGILETFTGGAQYSGGPGLLATIGSSSVGVLPVPFLVFVAVAVLAHLLLTRTIFGLRLRATGTRRAAAKVAGISTSRSLWSAFALCSVGAALAGMILAGYSSSAVSTMSAGYDFMALAAVVVGGTALLGGKGTIVGTVAGVLFLQVLLDLLSLVGLPYHWQQFIQGIVIVATLAVTAVLGRRSAS
ncbi:ABC transporter permease [Rhodococcus sp. NPDC127528]|uniref:ABC transporter permease n=1 Tax=unclassified Rhodococcus (in: high G+C Gram-positive bacteria) TaxID=192944 RepID=UPI00362F40F2